MNSTRTMLAVLVFGIATAAHAETSSAIAAADTENNAATIQKPARELRQDVWQAEKDFYSIYNDLNDDKSYDVRCFKEAPTGSVIKVQSCRPKFLDKALRDGKLRAASSIESNPEIANMIATFRKNLDAFLLESSELRSAATELNQARNRLTAAENAKSKN